MNHDAGRQGVHTDIIPSINDSRQIDDLKYHGNKSTIKDTISEYNTMYSWRKFRKRTTNLAPVRMTNKILCVFLFEVSTALPPEGKLRKGLSPH
jgi:hypothetical protein